MKKVLVLALAAMTVVGLFAAPASADIGQVVLDNLFLGAQGQAIRMEGNIDCTAGDEFLLRMNLHDADGNEAVGRASGVCAGDDTPWVTGAVRSFGSFECNELVEGTGQARSAGDLKRFRGSDATECN